MAKAVTISRYSADDRRGPAQASPFRSEDEGQRLAAAEAMIAKREHEIAGLEEILASVTDRGTKAVIRERIRASKNNLQSWKDYIGEDSYREPRAVIHPTPVKQARSRARKVA